MGWNLSDLNPKLRDKIVSATHDNHPSPHSSGSAAKLERPVGDGPLAAGETQEANTGRVLVRVTSVRRRLLDEDNLAEKYHVDCCRYAGLLRSDSPEQTKIEVSQRKAAKGEEEHTVIEITSP